MSGAQPLIIPAEVGHLAILRSQGHIYKAILPFRQPTDGRLVAFCWAAKPDARGRVVIFRHDLDLLGKASSRQITHVADERKAVRLTIARAVLFNCKKTRRTGPCEIGMWSMPKCGEWAWF